MAAGPFAHYRGERRGIVVIIRWAADEDVIAAAAVQNIRADSAEENVAALGAAEHIVTGIAMKFGADFHIDLEIVVAVLAEDRETAGVVEDAERRVVVEDLNLFAGKSHDENRIITRRADDRQQRLFRVDRIELQA